MEGHNLKYLILFIIFTLFASISEAQEIGFPIIRNYSPKAYNNSTQIFGAIQDTRGIFYFGVSGGLMEYDGVSWRTILNKKQAYRRNCNLCSICYPTCGSFLCYENTESYDGC